MHFINLFFYPYIRIFIHWPILSLIYSFLNVNTFLILIYIFSKHSSIIDKKYGVLKYNGAWSKFYGNFCNNNNDTIRITIMIMIMTITITKINLKMINTSTIFFLFLHQEILILSFLFIAT